MQLKYHCFFIKNEVYMTNQIIKPKAFISCSLRQEDQQFNNFVIEIVKRFGFLPFGTVGKYAAEPKPVGQLMKENIKQADCVILIATPRYIQQDLRDKNVTGKSISEMLHVETGMAMMAGKPILAFVQDGTEVGSFLPSVVQYINLNPAKRDDMHEKWPLIANYFRSAFAMIESKWIGENKPDILSLIVAVLAVIGAATVLEKVLES